MRASDIRLPIGSSAEVALSREASFFAVLLPSSLIFAMAETKELHTSVKFRFLLGKTAFETVMLPTAYEDDAVSKTQICSMLAHGR